MDRRISHQRITAQRMKCETLKQKKSNSKDTNTAQNQKKLKKKNEVIPNSKPNLKSNKKPKGNVFIFCIYFLDKLCIQETNTHTLKKMVQNSKPDRRFYWMH